MENKKPDAEAPTPLRRVARVGLSVINPFSDFAVIYRTMIKPVATKLVTLSNLLTGDAQARESLTWAQAVACSGLSADQLLSLFRVKRRLWWLLMVTAGFFAIALSLMILAAGDLPGQVLLRAVVMAAVTAMLAIGSSLKVLSFNFRLWQLVKRRVSLEEGGSFQHYQAEENVGLQVVTINPPY